MVYVDRNRSESTHISASALISPMAQLYGPVVVGEGAIIEGSVVVGYPTPEEMAAVKSFSERCEWETPEALYSASTHNITRIGGGSIVRSGSVIYSGAEIGCSVDVSHNCTVRENATIGDYCRMLPNTSIRKGVSVAKGCRLGGVISDRSRLLEYSTSLGYLVHEFLVGIGGEVEPAPVLGVGSVVGRGAVVVGGIKIGDFAFVGAGAIVRANVEPYIMVAGNPSRIVGRRASSDVERVQRRMARGEYL